MKISVVMPVFNAAAWLEETLETVRAQANNVGKQDVELIVVNDGSEDRSAELAREFLRHGLEGRVMATARNQGPAEARNLGWRSASGEWIQFLDADDLLGAGKFRHGRRRGVRPGQRRRRLLAMASLHLGAWQLGAPRTGRAVGRR